MEKKKIRNMGITVSIFIVAILLSSATAVPLKNVEARQTTHSTLNLLPDNDGTVQTWVPSPFSPVHWDKVDDPVGFPDEDTTYVFVNTVPREECFNHRDFAFLGVTITNVRVVARMKYSAIGLHPMAAVNIGLRIGAVRYPQFFNTNLISNYVDYIGDWANNPAPPGNPWTKSDIDNLQSSLLSAFARDSLIRCTQIYLIVTYTINNPPNLQSISP